MPKVKENSPAPDFKMKAVNGDTIQLSDFRDRHPVLLVFNRGFV